MKRFLYLLAVLVPVAALAAGAYFGFSHTSGAKAATICTPTGFVRDSINLTAATVVLTSGTTISNTQINAASCNIGVYVGPGLTNVVLSNDEIFGANYFGLVNNGSTVNITSSRIHDIGENPLNGDQHGVSIYFAYGSHAKGTISKNILWNYQKGGIVVNGLGSKATVSYNTVLGQGPVNYIAQNGIQIGYGAKASVTHNIVEGNSYTGAGVAASGGILVVGGSCYQDALTIGTVITNNIVVGNDVGIYLSNLDGTTCIPTNTPTNIKANNNTISNDAINNTTGAGAGAGYQAGISDQGDNDQMNHNGICGLGYTPVATPPPYLYFIDLTVTNSPTATSNYSCLDGSPITPSTASIKAAHAQKHMVVRAVR